MKLETIGMQLKALFVSIGLFFFNLVESKLHVGDKAPAFALHDQAGVAHSLEGLRGKKVALCFYPKDNTSGCTKQVCSLRDNWGELEAVGIAVFGINFDTQQAHQGFTATHKLPFPLLSDHDKKVASAYGATQFLLPIPKRITFIIDEQGIIAHIISTVDVNNHAQQILDVMRLSPHTPQ